MSLNSNGKNTLFSIEVFPPKDDVQLTAIYDNMHKFAALNPDFISVTYGAGGSTVGTSLEIASYIAKNFNSTPVAHLTCAGNTKAEIDSALLTLKNNGISNILALRGDLKEGREVTNFVHATDLIEYVNAFGGFEISAACYPEGHTESANANFDLKVLKMKYALGVRHFISQLFFDNSDFYRMVDNAADAGIDAKFEAGIMPVTNAKQILRMVGFSGAKLPSKLTKILSRYENNPVALRQAGLNYAIEQITDLLTSGVDGIHLYAMNSPLIATTIHTAISPLIEEINK